MKTPKLGNKILLACDGTGEAPRFDNGPHARSGLCRVCDKSILLRASGMIRTHGTFEQKLHWSER